MYNQRMLTLTSRVDVMNRLGRAMADPTRSRILLELLDAPGYPVRLSDSLGLTRTNVSNHLACLRGCGIVVATAEGRQTRYEMRGPASDPRHFNARRHSACLRRRCTLYREHDGSRTVSEEAADRRGHARPTLCAGSN